MSLDFNRPESWASSELHSLPTFNLESFQKKIDEIFPPTLEGFPIVRIVWAPDIKKCYSKFYCNWTAVGFGTDTELRAKYKYATVQLPNKDIIDIPPPRWILEQREEPGQYMASWEQTRWNKDGKEVRPPPPTTGYYSHLMTIAKHDSQCCKDAVRDKVVCWGKYRVPDEFDLNLLKTAKFKRDADTYIETDRPFTQKTLDILGRESNARAEAKQADNDAKLKEFIDDNALELISMFIGQPLSDKTKKFSFPAKKEQIINVCRN